MKDFLSGARLALPIILGYLPVGFAFGVLGMQVGMTPVTIGMMSYFVFAGSAQLIAVGLLSSGVGAASIIITTFVINLRHLLMSAAMAPHLRRWSLRQQAWYSFEMTDETFAAGLGRFLSHGVNRGEVLGLHMVSHMGWVIGGVGGALFGSIIGDVERLGLDFALPAMFIALLLPHCRVPRRLLAAVSGASLSVVFALVGAGQWNVMPATVAAASLAAFLPMDGGSSTEKGADHV